VENDLSSSATIKFARRLSDYGAPASVISKLVTTPNSSASILTPADLEAWNVQIVRDIPGKQIATPPQTETSPAPPKRAETIKPPPNPAAMPQSVALYEGGPSDKKGKRFVGSAIWRTVMVSPGPDLRSELAEVRADIEIPERHIKMVFFIRRNFDQVQQATSHFIEIMFYLPDKFPFGGIANVPGVLMKQGEQTRGSRLGGTADKVRRLGGTADKVTRRGGTADKVTRRGGTPDKVTANYFFIGLSAVKPDMQRNIQLLKERGWFEIPIVYNNGRHATLTIEKGTSGERVFQEAFKIWDGPSPGLPVPKSVPAPRPATPSGPARRCFELGGQRFCE
jgi:hypothetical protein